MFQGLDLFWGRQLFLRSCDGALKIARVFKEADFSWWLWKVSCELFNISNMIQNFVEFLVFLFLLLDLFLRVLIFLILFFSHKSISAFGIMIVVNFFSDERHRPPSFFDLLARLSFCWFCLYIIDFQWLYKLWLVLWCEDLDSDIFLLSDFLCLPWLGYFLFLYFCIRFYLRCNWDVFSRTFLELFRLIRHIEIGSIWLFLRSLHK